MTPDQILGTLATYDGLPREAMKAAREHRDEMQPRFLAHIERLATATVDTVTDVDKDACLFVFHLLCEWRDPHAYRPLTRLLRVDPKLLDLVLGDGLTQCVSRVIAGVFDGDLQPIFDVIEDPDADEFARSQMIDALVIIAHTRKCHDAIAARGAAAVIPPRRNAQPWKDTTAGAAARNEALRASRRFGRTIWRRRSGTTAEAAPRPRCIASSCSVSASWRGTSTVRSPSSTSGSPP